jgi:hypothetical protein
MAASNNNHNTSSSSVATTTLSSNSHNIHRRADDVSIHLEAHSKQNKRKSRAMANLHCLTELSSLLL